MVETEPVEVGSGTDDSTTNSADGVSDPRQDAIVDARLAAIATRFGDRWDEEQRARVRSGIARQVDLGIRVRRAPLANADEPEIVFAPFRAPDGGEEAS